MAHDSTKWLVSRVLVLKYVVLLGFLTVAAGAVVYLSDQAMKPVHFAEGTLYAVISALIISAFYDFFTRRELRILHEDELNRQLDLLGSKLLSSLDVARLSDEDMATLAGQIVANEQPTRAIANALLGPHGASFYENSLRPFVDQRVLFSVRVRNRLIAIEGKPDSYTMEFHQLFKAPAVKKSFFAVFSCDNEFFNNLVTSNADLDGLIGTSQVEWGDIDDQLRTLSLRGWRYVDGHRETRILKPQSLSSKELRRIIDQQTFDDNCMRAFSFALLDGDQGWTYEFSYAVRNALSDPYYYWFAENPMFVDRVEIDYQLLRPQIGRVSANCILGNRMIEAIDDQRSGTYVVENPGLVWPGQGALIVWRPQAAATAVGEGGATGVAE